MPFIVRDPFGKITRATVHPLPGAEMVSYQDPDLVAFLGDNGQNPKVIDDALAELRRTDGEMARAVEDVVTALLKKNVLKLTDLPKPVQDRIALRVRLRVTIQDALDRASGFGAGGLSSPAPAFEQKAPPPAAPLAAPYQQEPYQQATSPYGQPPSAPPSINGWQ